MSDIAPYTGPGGPGDVNWRGGPTPDPGVAGTKGWRVAQRGAVRNAGFFRNLGKQLQTPETRERIGTILDQNQKANYFRHAGLGAALRHTIGLPQTPSHLNDYFRAQSRRPQVGHDPQPTIVEPADLDEALHASGGEQGVGHPGYWAPFSGVPGSGSEGGEEPAGPQESMNERNRRLWQGMTGQGH